MKNIILNLCPTGIIPTKKLNNNVPIFPDEIAEDVYKCYQLGVQMVHIHARDNYGFNTMDKVKYEEIILKIREKCPDIIICASLSGRVLNTFEARSDVLNLTGKSKPDMGSLTLSSLNFSTGPSINSPEMIISLLNKMNENNIKPELEVFDVGMINFAKYLIKKGLLKPPYYFNIILGNISSAQNNMSDINSMISALPPDSFYCIGGIGNSMLGSNISGVLYADGVRVGLEDNMYYDNDRNILGTNEMFVKRIIDIANMCERKPYTCTEVRDLLKL